MRRHRWVWAPKEGINEMSEGTGHNGLGPAGQEGHASRPCETEEQAASGPGWMRASRDSRRSHVHAFFAFLPHPPHSPPPLSLSHLRAKREVRADSGSWSVHLSLHPSGLCQLPPANRCDATAAASGSAMAKEARPRCRLGDPRCCSPPGAGSSLEGFASVMATPSPVHSVTVTPLNDVIILLYLTLQYCQS